MGYTGMCRTTAGYNLFLLDSRTEHKMFHSSLEHGLFFFGSLHIVVRDQLYAGSRRLFSSLRDASVKAEETHGRSLATKIG